MHTIAGLPEMKLIDPDKIDEKEFNDFINEFKSADENLVPYSLNQKGLDFSGYIKSLNDESRGEGIPDNWVPASTYFLVDDRLKIYGAVNIRHRLTDDLKNEGGHIGYGIRPTVRRQGYGTRILELALDKIRAMGVRNILVTCEKGNTGSAKIIRKNGGKLDSEVEKNSRIIQRFWI